MPHQRYGFHQSLYMRDTYESFVLGNGRYGFPTAIHVWKKDSVNRRLRRPPLHPVNPFTHQLEDGIPSLRAHRKTLSERVFLDSGALFLDGTGREFGMTPWDSQAGELALVCL